MADLYFKAEDIAAVCKDLKNTNLSIDELSKKIREKAGINEAAKVISEFMDMTYAKAVFNLINFIKDNEPDLAKTLDELNQRKDIVKEIDERVMKIVDIQTNINTLYSKINLNAVDNVFGNLVKETVEVRKGMFELEYDFKLIDNKFYFLNSDYILKKDDGTIVMLDDVEYYYGRKFYTGDLNHNGKINLTYYRR